MKNIHILPTDKLSRLYLGNNGNFVFGMMQSSIQSRNDDFTNQNIFITSDEEIKEGDWIYNEYQKTIHKFSAGSGIGLCKKIILTTDIYLIKNGVQEINDKFLEWFVKNPSCEEVEIAELWKQGNPSTHDSYQIIIPKEEPKYIMGIDPYDDIKTLEKAKTNLEKLPFPELIKEFAEYYKNVPLVEEPKQETTLEEAAERLSELQEGTYTIQHKTTYKHGFQDGAKWQQERMYSEEELKSAFKIGFNIGYGSPASELDLKNKYCEKWFEQFKKK